MLEGERETHTERERERERKREREREIDSYKIALIFNAYYSEIIDNFHTHNTQHTHTYTNSILPKHLSIYKYIYIFIGREITRKIIHCFKLPQAISKRYNVIKVSLEKEIKIGSLVNQLERFACDLK